MSQIAKKDSWKTIPFSLGKTLTFPLSKSLTGEEFEQLKMGVIPCQMEDKWFVYYDEGYAYFHRSWTGMLIYKVKVEECKDDQNAAILTQVEVNNDPEQYKPCLDPIKKDYKDSQTRALQSVSWGVDVSGAEEQEGDNEEVRQVLGMIAWVIQSCEKTSYLGAINQYLRSQKQ